MIKINVDFQCTCGRGHMCPLKLIEYLLGNSETAMRFLFRQVDEKEAAEFLGCSVRSVQGQRLKGGGVPYVNSSRGSVRYRIFDLINYAETKIVLNTAGDRVLCHHALVDNNS